MFNLTRQEQLVILFLIGILLVGIGVKHYFNQQQVVTVSPSAPNLQNPQNTLTPNPANTYSAQTIIVHITGAVNNPGVYHLPAGSRIYDALTTAGDTTKQADVSDLNLAALIQDGEKIVVPILGSKPDPVQGQPQPNPPSRVQPAPDASIQSRSSGKININTASQAELETLPGIGPKLAQRIIQYRQQHGGFKRVDDVILVSGIGPKKMEQMKDLITVR
jgi:competence protein ComEA